MTLENQAGLLALTCAADDCNGRVTVVRAQHGSRFCSERCRVRHAQRTLRRNPEYRAQELERKRERRRASSQRATAAPAPRQCALASCQSEIPQTRRGNALYCSTECYRSAKSARSRKYVREYKKTKRQVLALRREHRRVQRALALVQIDLAPSSERQQATRILVDDLHAKYEAALEARNAMRETAQTAAAIVQQLAADTATLLPVEVREFLAAVAALEDDSEE